MKRLIFDLDNTISFSIDSNYIDSKPDLVIIDRIRTYKDKGFEIIISTSRNMRTYKGSIGKINAHTLPIIIEWLDKHNVPYDEIIVGKPWCGTDGFYIDDRAIRPSEFLRYDYNEIINLIDNKK
jgi:capsule biosynthesis phosphatase